MNPTQYISAPNALENLEKQVSTENYNTIYPFINEVATFIGYEQLNKFAGWIPGSGRARSMFT